MVINVFLFFVLLIFTFFFGFCMCAFTAAARIQENKEEYSKIIKNLQKELYQTQIKLKEYEK